MKLVKQFFNHDHSSSSQGGANLNPATVDCSGVIGCVSNLYIYSDISKTYHGCLHAYSNGNIRYYASRDQADIRIESANGWGIIVIPDNAPTYDRAHIRINNGNLALGNVDTGYGGMLGGIMLGPSTPPSTYPSDRAFIYNNDVVAGNAAIFIANEANDVNEIYKETAMTAADASSVDSTYGNEERDVIINLRTRLNELESKLQSLGFLA
ncbi:MAG: hypothetical protein JSW62_04790 [Thermoplasmatales archaeon]|nr:MAG: hypothetical protein JSW62_04790 [Thermoplasmatales archaeon]